MFLHKLSPPVCIRIVYSLPRTRASCITFVDSRERREETRVRFIESTVIKRYRDPKVRVNFIIIAITIILVLCFLVSLSIALTPAQKFVISFFFLSSSERGKEESGRNQVQLRVFHHSDYIETSERILVRVYRDDTLLSPLPSLREFLQSYFWSSSKFLETRSFDHLSFLIKAFLETLDNWSGKRKV